MPTRPTTTPINQSQFLHVTIDMPAAAKPKFVTAMRKVLPLFTALCPPTGPITTFGWVFLAAMTTGTKGQTRFVHLWKTPNPGRPLIADVMAVCGADNRYGALDALVDVEVQDILHSNDAYTPLNWPATPPKAYVHEILNVSADTASIAKLESRMPVIAFEMNQKFGWVLLSAMVSNTGQLRRFVHFWQVRTTTPASISAASKFLLAQPEFAKAVQGRTAEVCEAVTYSKRTT